MSTESESHHFSADNTISQGSLQNNNQTKRNAGIGLIAVSAVVVFLTAYLMWVKAAFVSDPLHHAERIRPYWMFAGLVVLLACNMFLAGVFLLKSSCENGGHIAKTRSLATALYLTGSVNIGLFAAFLDITRFQPAGFLAYFICLPTIIFRMFAGPMTSLSSNPAIAYTVIILFYIIFYVCFFYPLYKRQYVAIGIFCAMILGIGLLLLVVFMTLHSME